MFLAGPKFKNPPASKLASDLWPFDPGIIIISYSQLFYNFQIFTKEDVGGKEKIKQKKQGIIPAFIMSLSYGTCIILLNFL